MIPPETLRKYDVLIATRVYGWKEKTFRLVRGLEYNEKVETTAYPVVIGEKVLLVSPDSFGQPEATLWWHEFDIEKDTRVPHFSSDRRLAAKLMEHTAKQWGWKWLVDIDESRTAIKVRVSEDSPPEAAAVIGPFAAAICCATIKALGLEVPG